MTIRVGAFGRAPLLFAQVLGENWWLFLVRGLAGIGFGILAFIWPGITLLTLVLMYGAFVLIDGVCALVCGFLARGNFGPCWWLVGVGVLGIGVGVATFLWPGLTALVLLFFIAAWAITTGIFQIVGAIQLRKEIENEWWLILSGVLSVVIGAALFAAPGAGALALIWLIALYAVLYGIAMASFALTLRKLRTVQS
jgi:uncharacterized membrane protein HdeD (DUF308 family)